MSTKRYVPPKRKPASVGKLVKVGPKKAAVVAAPVKVVKPKLPAMRVSPEGVATGTFTVSADGVRTPRGF